MMNLKSQGINQSAQIFQSFPSLSSSSAAELNQRTSAQGSSQSQSDTRAGGLANNNTTRSHTLTRVILSSCIPLMITVLVLLAIFTTTSESASLTSKPGTTDHRNDRHRTSLPAGGHHTLTSISDGHSYMYQIPPAAPSYQSIKKIPKVLLRLSSESGILRPNQQQKMPTTTTTTTEKNLKASYQSQKYNTDDNNGDLSNEEDKSDFHENDQGDYPYQYYLDFDENLSQQQSQYKTEFLPSPSETVLHRAQYDQHNQANKNIWSDYLSLSQITTTSPHAATNDINLNEVYDPVDNYTIPSLRDYKFPEFKPQAQATSTKSNYLNPYEFFSEEDLENVADLDGDHSKYFVKTKPRDVSSSIANIYNSFYYEPPSYSTKTQPLPVKAKFPLANDEVEREGFDGPNSRGNKLDFFDSFKNFKNLNEEKKYTFPIQTTPMTNYEPITTETSTSSPSPVTTIISTTSASAHEIKVNTDSSTAESIVSSNQIVTPVTSPSLPDTTSLNLIPDIVSKQTTTDATSIPGMPGIDYPIFDEVPTTSFDCQKQRYKGFFADIDTKCQAWHYCDFTDGHSTFLCPNGTLFSQVLLTCDWWFNVNCKEAQQLYVLNERLYRYIKPPKPSFPEDYHGPQVDQWLLKQLELGLLPKIKKRGKVEKPVVTPSP